MNDCFFIMFKRGLHMKSDKKHIGIIILIYILLFLFFYFFKSNNENTFVNQFSQSPNTDVQI